MWLTFSKHANLLADLIDRTASTGEVMDMFALFNRFTLDSIGEVGFGRNIGSLENPENPVLKAFDIAQVCAAERFIQRSVHWRFDRLVGHPAEREMKLHCNALDKYARNIAVEAWQAYDLNTDASSTAA